MRAGRVIAYKEIASFFSSLIAYVVISVFLIGTGLIVWVFPGNIPELRTASLDPLFSWAPWFYLFLVPAITMRSFSEEFRLGTLEFLYTKPVTSSDLIAGKYAGALALVIISLFPTLVYYLTVIWLGYPPGNIDHAATIGSYLGLFFIGAVFASVGIFASSLTNNQIVAFLLGAFFSFFLYAGFDSLAEVPALRNFNTYILQIGLLEHYRSISRGVIDTRDVLYFLSIIFIMLFATQQVIEKKIQ